MNESEKILTGQIIGECRRLGLLVHHCRDSRRCQGTKGMPDLVIASHRGILLAEIKSADGETSPGQDRWLYTLHQAGILNKVWRPGQWMGIEESLEAMA